MKKKEINWIILLIVFGIIILAKIILSNKSVETSNEIAQCIGENSVLYTQLGCHACEAQKNIFGESYQYLNEIDCFYEREKCSEITATPTWLINGEKYIGVQSIEELRELTKC